MSNYYAHPTQDDDICLSPTNSCESSDDSGPLDPKRRKYQCVICQKYFSRPSALRTHSYTHTGEKPFECDAPGCGRRFAVISNLRRHFKVHRKMPSTTISGGSHAKIPASERLRCVQQLMERTAHRQHERTQHQQPGTHGTASYSNHYHCDPNDAVEKQQQQQRSWMMPPSPPLSAGLSSEEYSASCMESCEEMPRRIPDYYQFMVHDSHHHRRHYQQEQHHQYRQQHPQAGETSQQHITSASYYCHVLPPPEAPQYVSSTSLSQAQQPTTAALTHISPGISLPSGRTHRSSGSLQTTSIRGDTNICYAHDQPQQMSPSLLS